jgi:hypothetical protein
MTSFGQWYEEKKSEESGETSSSWFDTESLPLFNSESMQSFSFGNLKASMEAQMPKKVLGMGYQERFQASCVFLPQLPAFVSCLTSCPFDGLCRYSADFYFYRLSSLVLHFLWELQCWQ